MSTTVSAVLGPILIYPNTEYRTANPVIGQIVSTIKLSRSDIESTGVNTFGELLTATPGVLFEGGQGNLTALRIRGNEARHTLLLVDGNVVSISATQPNFDVVPLDQIERVEINKGPFSSLYGPGAIGGVIHVFTNKYKHSETRSKIHFTYGSHDSKKVALNASVNNDDSYVNYSLSRYHTDGIDATGDGDLDSVDIHSGSFNIGANLSVQTSAKLNILKTNATIEYDNLFGGKAKPDNDLTQFNVSIDHQFDDKLKTKIDYSNQKIQRRDEVYKLDTVSVINEYTLDDEKRFLGLTNTIDKSVNNGQQIKHTDVFFQWQKLLTYNELSIGARIVNHDKFGMRNTYNFNWAKNLDNQLRVNASFGKAIKLPSHYQNNLNIVHNKTDLKPEHAKNFELGVIKHYNDWNLSGKIYKSKVTNMFSWIDPDNNFSTDDAYYINNGNVDIKGVELMINKKILGWDMAAYYDYNTAIDNSNGLQKGRRPNHSVSINMNKKSENFNYRLNLIGKSWVWDTDAHSNNDKLSGYGLLNLLGSYDYSKKTLISININNALDKQYTMAKGYNTLGRSVTLSVDYTF